MSLLAGTEDVYHFDLPGTGEGPGRGDGLMAFLSEAEIEKILLTKLQGRGV